MARIHLDQDAEDDADDQNYHESSDEDFNPETAPAQDASSSEDEHDVGTSKPKPRGKRKAATAGDELDSGDEVTIQAAKRKKSTKKKKGRKDDNEGDEDDDIILSDHDEGGLIKTRAQRAVEKRERRPLARTDGATVDVDALWAQMTAAPLGPVRPSTPQTADAANADNGPKHADDVEMLDEEQVIVKKTFTFAGQDTTEEKHIPLSQLDKYLSDGWKDAAAAIEKAADASQPLSPKVRRPLRRPSRFDPNPIGYVRALAPEYQLSWPRKSIVALEKEQENAPEPEPQRSKTEKAQKLNVVTKSRMDWTGFVEKEGIAEELDTHGKTKEAYLGRMQFLAGVEARREEERLKMKSTTATSK